MCATFSAVHLELGVPLSFLWRPAEMHTKHNYTIRLASGMLIYQS